MSEIGRKIVAYHPEIRVKRGDKLVAIKADMDDWYEDSEVLTKLAAVHPGCQTVGDLVQAIEKGDLSPQEEECGIMACRISDCGVNPQDEHDPPREWDEPI